VLGCLDYEYYSYILTNWPWEITLKSVKTTLQFLYRMRFFFVYIPRLSYGEFVLIYIQTPRSDGDDGDEVETQPTPTTDELKANRIAKDAQLTLAKEDARVKHQEALRTKAVAKTKSDELAAAVK
jgi:hypothetical protein